MTTPAAVTSIELLVHIECGMPGDTQRSGVRQWDTTTRVISVEVDAPDAATDLNQWAQTHLAPFSGEALELTGAAGGLCSIVVAGAPAGHEKLLGLCLDV